MQPSFGGLICTAAGTNPAPGWTVPAGFGAPAPGAEGSWLRPGTARPHPLHSSRLRAHSPLRAGQTGPAKQTPGCAPGTSLTILPWLANPAAPIWAFGCGGHTLPCVRRAQVSCPSPWSAGDVMQAPRCFKGYLVNCFSCSCARGQDVPESCFLPL